MCVPPDRDVRLLSGDALSIGEVAAGFLVTGIFSSCPIEVCGTMCSAPNPCELSPLLDHTGPRFYVWTKTATAFEQ